MQRYLRGFRVLLAFSFRTAPREAALFLVSGAVMSLMAPLSAYSAKLLVDAVLAGSIHRGLVAAAFLSLAGALALINVLYYIDLLFSVVEKAGAAVDKRLIELIAGVPGLQHHEMPEYLDQLDLLREQRSSLAWMTNATAGMVRVLVLLLASGILLARLHPALLLLPLVGIVSFLAGRKAQILQQEAAEGTVETERLRRHLFEISTSAAVGKEIRVFGLEDTLLQRHHDAAGAVLRTRNGADWRSAALQSVDALVSGAAYAAAIGLILVRAIHGQATPGDVILAVGLAAGMNDVVFTAVMYGTSFLHVLRVAQRYLWLEEYAQRVHLPSPEPAGVPGRLQTGIVMRDVSFRYPGTDRGVLEHVSLDLPAGSIIALVGENGAGKTTLIKLLTRFYEPTGGEILVDGVDVRRFQVPAWRRRISGAFQDFTRFEFRAGEVVGVGQLAEIDNDAALAGALMRAGASDVPARLPDGLATQLGRDWEGGVELSGGQWQKLALARAMMRDLPILLVLDEPTASLDAQTEHDLFERYARAAREAADVTGTIILLVTHRFSTVRMADRIVVLAGGQIKETGTHDELMAARGDYAELYELQARGYR